MKDKKNVSLFLYLLFIVLAVGTLYLSYALFLNYNPEDNGNIKEIGDFETYTAIFEINGATSIGTSSLSCDVVNNKCQITLPNIFLENGIVLGWNTENQNYAKYQVGESINLTSNQIFYAITYREKTLKIIDNKLDYLSSKELSCRAYNKEEQCSVILPIFNKIGYESRGYSTRSDSLTGIFFPNQTYSLKKDTTLYPIYNLLTKGRKINVDKTINKYNIFVEIEKGCPSEVSNGYLEFINQIHNKAKYLLIGSKLTFMSETTFNEVWGKNYLGMNYGPNLLRLVDIKCPTTFNRNYYETLVHELAHTWDFYYSNYFDKNISDQNDFVNLYSKYRNSSSRPFREYSYSNIREFFADSVRYYYFKYIEPISNYSKLDYPSDIKNTLEKYIYIANKGYFN